MFFPDKITKIKATDRVLEVGPGSTPHPRADVFLEKIFENEAEFRSQRGETDRLQTNKKTFYYESEKFPFADKEFDYVICSHVLEHVKNPETFLSEIFRVSSNGYLEFPTAYYDFLYNFPVHCNLLLCKGDTIFWLPKSEAGLERFKGFHEFFYETLKKQHFDMIDSLREYFFQGIEFESPVKMVRVNKIDEICFDKTIINTIPERKKPSQQSSFIQKMRRKISEFVGL